MVEAVPDKNRAVELRKLLEVERDEQGRPKRVRSFVTYHSDPERVVEVPFTTPGDVVAAERKFGEGEKRFDQIAGGAEVKSWMTYKALCRHPVEMERPTVPFDDWLEQVDHLYDEEPDVGPLAERLAEMFSQLPLPQSSGG